VVLIVVRFALRRFAALLLFGCSAKEAPVPVVVPECGQAREMTGLKECEFEPAAGSKTTHAAVCRMVVDLNNKGERE
jgi:hypothetical protein